MKITYSRLARILFVTGAISLIGCASYRPPVVILEAKIPAAKVAAARSRVKSIKEFNKVAETVAAASADVCAQRGYRLPFFAAINPQSKDEELRAAFLIAGLQEQPQFISTGPSTQALDGRYITKVGTEAIYAGESEKAYWTAMSLVIRKPYAEAVPIEFADKTKGTINPYMGCAGTVLVDLAVNEPLDFGLGMELLPIEWFQSAKAQDELLFLAGRSLYFASDVGAERLTKGLYAGAALNGILTGLTLGASRNFVDAKFVVTRLLRAGLLKEADEFGLRAAVRAGADPKVVISYVERLAADKEVATKFKELWFEDGRVAKMAVVAGELIANRQSDMKPGAVALGKVPPAQ